MVTTSNHVLVNVADFVRGVFLAKGPDSSVGGAPVGYCPDEIHR